MFDVHVPEFLRIGDEQAGEFRQRPPPLAHDPQDLKSGKETVAGCAVFTENKMAGLLPAKESPLLAHGRHDMAIAYVGTDKRTAPLLHEHFKRHVAHDRGHKDVARKLALLHEILRAQGHDLVAIQNGAFFVHDDEAIGIAVQSKPNIGPRLADLRGHSLGVQGTAAVIDIQPVGLRTDFNDFGAQLLKGQRRDPIVGAIGAVNDHPQPFKGQVRGETVFEIHDVTTRSVLDFIGTAGVRGFGIIPVKIRVQHHFRHAIFIGIRDFEPFGVEKLDPIVAEWIMRRGDDHPHIRPHVGREKGNRRSGQGADKKDIHPRRQQARRQRVLEHISRKAGILTDDYAAASVLVPIERASGKPQAQSHFRRHRILVDPAPHPVSPKKTNAHQLLQDLFCYRTAEQTAYSLGCREIDTVSGLIFRTRPPWGTAT